MIRYIIMTMILLSSCNRVAYAQYNTMEGHSINTWADAIHKAEGNDNYGILQHYKHTSYREACINTIKHKYQQWLKAGSPSTYLHFLAVRYCPVGCWNDNGTNKYWEDNVKYWLYRLEK